MPKNLAPSLSSGELRVVLLHELAHIRRGDLWVNLAATILQIFYFYNPLLWLANAMIRRAREQAVDEMVLVAMGDNAPQYPQTLLSVAKMAFKRPALSLRLTGVVESRSALTGRIKHILNRPMPKTAKLGIIGLAVVLAAAAVLLPMAAFLPGPPELVVKGTVRDAQTGKPIAGARVFDDGYGPTPAWDQIRPGERSEWGAITNAAGEYSFLTWPEHHSVSAEAPGYTLERESLYENHFTVNDTDEQTMNFVLVPMAVTAPAKEGIGTDSVDAESVVVPILGYDVKLEGSDNLFTVHGTVTDDSGSPVEGVQLTADCGHGKLERTGRTVTDKNGRYTLGLTSSIKNPGADPYDVGIQAARIKARARGFYEVNLCRGGNLAMAGKPPGPDEEQFVAGYAGVVLPHRPYELNFVMRPAARIEGNLVDERDNPVRRKSVWLHGDGLLKYSSLVGSANQDGRFEIDHIPCGTVWFKSVDRQLVESGTVNLPTPGIYRVRLRIGESPTGRPTLRISECHALASSLAQPDQRRVVDPNGNPVAGAQVALCTRDKGVVIRAGKLGPNRMGDRTTTIAETDADGSFDFSDWPDSFHLIAAHDKGFAWVTREQFTASPAIWLQSWSRIEGRLYIGRDAGAGKRMDLLNYINKNAIDRGVRLEYEADTDGEGRFAFNRIPPGWLEIGYLTRMGDSSWSQTGRMPVQIHPGVTLRIAVGGRGRPVVGKFVPPKGYDKPVYFGEGLRALNTVRPDRPKPENYDQMSKRQQQDWYNKWSETSEARTYYDTMWRDPGRRQYVFHIERDGSFRIEDVIAGRYSFTVWIEERLSGQGRPEEIGSYYGSIKVPEMAGGRSDEPLDLGELELSMREPVRVGDAAPLFEARTLDGERVKLSDYRGRFVLLSFWQPVFHPELERLKILAAGYNAVGRLEIIGLGGNDTLEEVKRYVEENDIPWPQIFVGEELGSGIAEDYGIPGMPAIFLVGPDGRIVAKDLRGEKLSSTVLEALESTEQHRTEAPPFSRNKVTDIELPFTFTIYTLTPDNEPQPGVKVRCLHPRPERAEPIVDMVVESDRDGIAEFTITQADLLTDWMYWFSLDDEDFVGAPGVGITPDEGDWTFRVLPAEEFELQVIGDKKPVSGATVHLQIDHGEGKDWDPKRFWAYEKVLTDSAGQARAKFVKGRISMAIAAKGYASKMISNVELPTEKPYKIELAKGRDIAGRVVDPNDKPLA
ncbi:MAG: carboxypeptidase regulatory-like domain-containing protein, partial [Planctomycetota bacterium]